jgi:hypothetical protein
LKYRRFLETLLSCLFLIRIFLLLGQMTCSVNGETSLLTFGCEKVCEKY